MKLCVIILNFYYRSSGEWTRAGCHTELPEDNWWKKDPIYINCTCNQLSTYAVLTDVVDEHVNHFFHILTYLIFEIAFYLIIDFFFFVVVST